MHVHGVAGGPGGGRDGWEMGDDGDLSTYGRYLSMVSGLVWGT